MRPCEGSPSLPQQDFQWDHVQHWWNNPCSSHPRPLPLEQPSLCPGDNHPTALGCQGQAHEALPAKGSFAKQKEVALTRSDALWGTAGTKWPILSSPSRMMPSHQVWIPNQQRGKIVVATLLGPVLHLTPQEMVPSHCLLNKQGWYFWRSSEELKAEGTWLIPDYWSQNHLAPSSLQPGVCNLISTERCLPPLERQKQNNQNGGQIFKSHYLAEPYGTPRNRATILHTKGRLSVVEKALQEGGGLFPL